MIQAATDYIKSRQHKERTRVSHWITVRLSMCDIILPDYIWQQLYVQSRIEFMQTKKARVEDNMCFTLIVLDGFRQVCASCSKVCVWPQSDLIGHIHVSCIADVVLKVSAYYATDICTYYVDILLWYDKSVHMEWANVIFRHFSPFIPYLSVRYYDKSVYLCTLNLILYVCYHQIFIEDICCRIQCPIGKYQGGVDTYVLYNVILSMYFLTPLPSKHSQG